MNIPRFIHLLAREPSYAMKSCGSIRTTLPSETMEEKDDPVTTCTSEAAAPIPTDLPLTDTRPTLACVPARRFHGLMPLQLAKKWANARLAQQNARERRRAFIKSFELRVLDISSTWPHTELQLVSEQNEVL
ncbi:hypothetical protein BDV34DRAFT_197769 [Aspergillus parasiticus]|uniref:Uncharacterized protein n=1 Tax=Aspergillus parasiticus TaxID=5067 RepID=A0A5N6DGG3_ASPPA|nr:hypothetical protein BDV34DRAFT_197769 [Aspergillus parasiticus]